MLPDMLYHGLLYTMVGVLAGLLSGLLGLGGGVVMVPALLLIFAHDPLVPDALAMRIAVGTSLATMMFTSFFATRTHRKKGNSGWDVFKRMAPGIVIGVLAGGLLADVIPSAILKKVFMFFLLFVAIRMFVASEEFPTARFPRSWITYLVSAWIGFFSGLLGVGGGILIIPYLSWCRVDMKKITAVAAMGTLTIALLGAATFMITGANEPGLPAWSSGYVYWLPVACLAIPGSLISPLATRLAYRLPVRKLKLLFVFVLLVTVFIMAR